MFDEFGGDECEDVGVDECCGVVELGGEYVDEKWFENVVEIVGG